jgi:hypothetical protein
MEFVLRGGTVPSDRRETEESNSVFVARFLLFFPTPRFTPPLLEAALNSSFRKGFTTTEKVFIFNSNLGKESKIFARDQS